jgi:flagellar biosynthesis protein FliQ
MPKFYEMKLLTVAGYISLIIFSIIAYFGGRILPIGLGIIPIPLIFGLVISIYYIKLSIENKKLHFLCFSVIIFIIAFIAGINVDNYETENTRKYLINAGNIIEDYKLKNGIENLTENDIDNIILSKNTRIELMENTYKIYFKGGIYNSETKKVNFRPRP